MLDCRDNGTYVWFDQIDANSRHYRLEIELTLYLELANRVKSIEELRILLLEEGTRQLAASVKAA
jgi:hypothetical protein